MIKKIVIGVCGLVFVFAFAFPAFADPSIGYRKYFNEGVIAFKEHDDQRALRCFKIAQIYDPADKNLRRYLAILKQRGVILELHPSLLPPEQTIGYRYYLSGGIKAFQGYNDKKAIFYFKIALIFNPASKEAKRYLKILYQRQGLSFLPENLLPQVIVQSKPYTLPVQAQPAGTIQSAPAAVPAPQVDIQPQSYTPPVQVQQAGTTQSAPAAVVPAPEVIAQPQPSSSSPQPSAVMLKSSTYIAEQKAKQAPAVLSIEQLTKSGQAKPVLIIELNSSVILEGQNIKQFLMVDQGFISVKILDSNHLKIDAIGIGTTFLHVWDDLGRRTFYVEVVFPKSINSGKSQEMNGIQHGQPFIVTYTNDWVTYYAGKNIPALKRQTYNFNQTLAVTGETPYGFLDASGSYTDEDANSSFDAYTIGLSQIPLEGTSNFDLRGFDASRYLSPLTLPGTVLRGAFADVDLLGDTLGVSLSHGQVQETQGFFATGASQYNDSYIDAAKLTLFPKSNTDQYSFNYATSYGVDRPNYLTDHVYSLQGHHQFNDYLSLDAEQATDTNHDSSLASLGWQEGSFKSAFNFRNVDKDYSTISSYPAYQGETGLTWTTDTDFQNLKENTFLEAYQDHLNSGPSDSDVFNYDGYGSVRADITKNVWSDSYFSFQDTPGELSPTSSIGFNERISRSFSTWNSLQGTVFGATGYQTNHSSDSSITDYNREDVIAGIELPLTHQVSAYANYEYDWLDQPHSGGNSNPSVVNTGLSYQKQLTSELSFNSSVDYHDELGVKANSNSYLSGEQSVIISSGLNYTPTSNVTIFGDCEASQILSHIGNPSADDFEAHVGMRITFGGETYWDPMGTVSGIVFIDEGGDGRFVAGDKGIPGVKVKVGDKDAVTDKNGRYSIKIRAHGVDVAPLLDTVPGGLLFSTPQTLNVRVFQGRVSHADFGFSIQTGIYGIIFVSKNGSNIPNETDKFIGKVKVVLDDKFVQRSDSQGSFYFRKVTPGQHIISIDINTLALDMVPIVGLRNKINVVEGTNYMFNIPLKIEKAQGEQQ